MYTSLVSLDSVPSALARADCLVIISASKSLPDSLPGLPPSLTPAIHAQLAISSQPPFVIHHVDAPAKRLVFALFPAFVSDTADSRTVCYSTGKQTMALLASLAVKNPLLYFPDSAPLSRDKKTPNPLFSHFIEATLLGCFQEAYVPLQAREHYEKLSAPHKPPQFSVCAPNCPDLNLAFLTSIEHGKTIARDIGGADPERMTPLRCAKHIMESFKATDNIKISVEKDPEVMKKEYPLLHAVARASLHVPRHAPCVVKLEYISPSPASVTENLFFVGKGVTYDTGGADIKAGGAMRGMCRDKCGAASVAGLFKTLALLKPKKINATAYLGFVRNSVGSDAYVSDEIIVSRAGVRCLIGNTDAEGRMVMTDLVCKAKEEALLKSQNLTGLDGTQPARIFTVATLTGHAVRAVGPYACILDNGPAREHQISARIKSAGDLLADLFEISSLRHEDFQFVKAGSQAEDVVQANDRPSTMTNRGHQFPMAFMTIASGLDKHGLDSDFPICYSHVDIAGSAEEDGHGLSLGKCTGSSVSAFVKAFAV